MSTFEAPWGDMATTIYRVPSKSEPGVFYEVSLGPPDVCGCEGWKRRGKCSHIKSVRDALTNESQ